jgi:hypothetical protein
MSRPKPRFRYHVTFEYALEAPDTVRGEIEVSNPSQGVRRAFEAAKKANPGRQWSSVVVLLERAA